MKCPVDGATLVMTERSGVEIDYCPQCRGVWLDRGELDKIIERATPSAALQEPPQNMPRSAYREPHRGEHHEPRRDHASSGHHRYEHGDDHHGRKRRRGLLGDIFDF